MPDSFSGLLLGLHRTCSSELAAVLQSPTPPPPGRLNGPGTQVVQLPLHAHGALQELEGGILCNSCALFLRMGSSPMTCSAEASGSVTAELLHLLQDGFGEQDREVQAPGAKRTFLECTMPPCDARKAAPFPPPKRPGL